MKRMMIVFLALAALVQCRKADVLEFPLIQTGEVSNISENGATFTAKIINIGVLQVESYGFVWGLKANPDLESSNLSLSGNVEKGVFSANVTNDLLPDTTYFVRAFITDSKTTTYGKTVSFRSLGSTVPVITDFHPKSGVENTVVVIKGDHFSGSLTGNKVHFGIYPAKVEKASKTELEVVLPGAINITGYVDIEVETATQIGKSSEKFFFEGCIIHGFEPKVVKFSDIISIFVESCLVNLDEPYSYDLNIGGYPATIESIENNIIRVKLHPHTRFGKRRIAIHTEGKSSYSVDSIQIVSPWEKLTVTPPLMRRNPSGFMIGNEIFLGLGAERSGSTHTQKKDFYRYVPDQQNWIAIEDIPSPERENSPSFVLEGKAYIILGENANQAMLNRETFAYDPQTGSWSQKANFPLSTRSHAIGFSLGNFGYAGLGLNQRDFLRYNPQSDSWSLMDIYPNQHVFGAFAVADENRAYVGMGRTEYVIDFDRNIYKFEPNADNNWSLLTTFPGAGRSLASAFIIDNYLYAGLGLTFTTYRNDLWRYDLENDVWSAVPDFPFTLRTRPQVFVVDGKALFVSGDAENMGADETVIIFDPN